MNNPKGTGKPPKGSFSDVAPAVEYIGAHGDISPKRRTDSNAKTVPAGGHATYRHRVIFDCVKMDASDRVSSRDPGERHFDKSKHKMPLEEVSHESC